MRCLILLACSAAVFLYQPPQVISQEPEPLRSIDSDLDGLNDELEQSVLQQFVPTFMTNRKECSGMPAEFAPDTTSPEVVADNGTIYGQVFPAKPSDDKQPVIEVHFYHLWKLDCGPHGHALDAEHVSALLRSSAWDEGHSWQAIYWYAAAHEDTVCDVSQITRASTIQAENHGATVWISAGKHASFLNP